MEYVRFLTPEEVYLVLTTILTTLLIQMAIYFFIKWRRYDKKLRLQDQVINLSLSIFFLFWGISNIIDVPYDLGAREARLLVLKTDLLFFVVGTFSLIYTIMKILEIKHKKIYLTALLASIIFVLVSRTAVYYIWYYSVISAILFAVVIYFAYKANIIVQGITRKNLLPVIVGFLIFCTSYVRKNLAIIFSETFNVLELDDMTVLHTGKLVDIAGMLLITLGFYTVEFAELKWKGAIKHLMVINNGGICLYHYSFVNVDKNAEEFDRQLVAGAIMGVQSILGEIIDKQKTEQLEVVDYKGKKLIFKRGKYVNVVLIAEQDLVILHEKLEKLIADIESQFEKYLKDNITKIDVYKPIGFFIEDIFQIEKTKQEIILES